MQWNLPNSPIADFRMDQMDGYGTDRHDTRAWIMMA